MNMGLKRLQACVLRCAHRENPADRLAAVREDQRPRRRQGSTDTRIEQALDGQTHACWLSLLAVSCRRLMAQYTLIEAGESEEP